MRALVQQYAAAFPCPGRAPGTGVVVSLCPVPVGNNPVDPFQRTEPSALEQLLQRTVAAVGPLVEHEGQGSAGSVSCPDHSFHLRCPDGRRFFTQDIQSLFHCLNADFLMLEMRNGNQHRVACAAADQFTPASEDPRMARQVLLCPFKTFRPQVRCRGQFDLGTFPGQDRPAMLRSHIPDPDDPQPDPVSFHA